LSRMLTSHTMMEVYSITVDIIQQSARKRDLARRQLASISFLM